MHLVNLIVRYCLGCSLSGRGMVTCPGACPSSTSTTSLPCLASFCWSVSENCHTTKLQKDFRPTWTFCPQCFITLAMLSTSNVYILINFTSFVESFFITFSVGGLLYLRYCSIEFPFNLLFNVSQVETTRPWETDQGEHRPPHRLLHRLQLPHPHASLRGAWGEQISTGKCE